MATDHERAESSVDRFTLLPSAPTLTHADAGHLAVVCLIAGEWSWIVWHAGSPVHGLRAKSLSLRDACADALRCIEACREPEPPPGFFPGRF